MDNKHAWNFIVNLSLLFPVDFFHIRYNVTISVAVKNMTGNFDIFRKYKLDYIGNKPDGNFFKKYNLNTIFIIVRYKKSLP